MLRLREKFQNIRISFPRGGPRLEESLDELRAEGLEEVRKDLQKIRSREKFNIVIEPLPGHDQEYWFAKLESNQVWDKVFGYLTSPSDITSAYFACETFRRILEERKLLMLLPNVLRTLKEQGFHFGKPKENRFILNLRCTSKSWKRIFEEEFFERQYQEDGNLDVVLETWNKNIPSWCRFKSEDDIDQAMTALSCLGPALIRTIELPRDPVLLQSIHSKLIDFLGIHGNEIWGLKFRGKHAKPYRYDENKYIEILHDVASRTPQLKALELNLESGHRSNWAEQEMFRQNVNKYPFPKIASLEIFQFDYSRFEHEYLIADVLRKNEKIYFMKRGESNRHGGFGPLAEYFHASNRNFYIVAAAF